MERYWGRFDPYILLVFNKNGKQFQGSSFLTAEKEKGDHYLPETSVCATSPLLSRPIFFPPSASLLPIKIEFVCHFTWST